WNLEFVIRAVRYWLSGRFEPVYEFQIPNSKFLIESDEEHLADGRDAAEFFQRGIQHPARRFLVHIDDADGAGCIAAEREVGDVDAVAAENGPDLADHARLIVVRDDQHRAAERRFHVDAADRDEPRTVRLEHRAFDPPLAAVGVQLDRHEAAIVPRPRAPRFDDVDAVGEV